MTFSMDITYIPFVNMYVSTAMEDSTLKSGGVLFLVEWQTYPWSSRDTAKIT